MCKHACVLSRFSTVRLFATLWTVAHQDPLSMRFSRQEYWSGLPCPSPGDLPDPRIEPVSPALAGRFFIVWATREAPHEVSSVIILSYGFRNWGPGRLSGIFISEEDGGNPIRIFQGRKSTDNGFVGNTESKTRVRNILLRNVETVTEEELQNLWLLPLEGGSGVRRS